MATTTQNDNRAKFLELRKQGISVADARNQTYWPPPVVPDATPEPTTPVAPVTPPTAPTVTWVDWQQFVQAPVDPTTGLSKPLEPVAQPAPVTQIQAEVKSPEPIKTEVASSTAKTEPVIDYNVSAGREWEIQDNIAKITQTNPKLLKDRNAYNQAFGYETADAGKKALLDSTFSGQVKPSQDDIFNSMRQGVSVWDPKSTEFRQAQARINTFKKFSVYDTASLATSLQSGDLLVGTKAYNDLVSDPTMALKIQKAQAFNKWVVDLVKTGETQMANVLAQNPTVAQALEDGNLSKAEYDQLTNNAEVSAQWKLVETNKTKYETIKAQYDAVEDDVDSEYAGKEVTDSFKAKIVADRRKGMYKDYQIASLEYQNSLGTYTNLKADSTALLAQNMELYKTEQANKAEIAKEDRAMQNALALSQAQFDQKLAQQTQLTNDPTTAITTMIDEYKKLGVPFSRSTQQVISDFQTSGKDLPTYLSDLQKTIQTKPEYQKIKELQMGQLSDAQKMTLWYQQDINKMAISNQNVTSNKWTKLDDGMYTNEAGEIITADELKSAKLLGNSYITKQVWEEGGECGFYASRGTGMSATPGGNSKEERFNAFSETTPQVWGMAFFGGEWYDKTYWHIAIVTGVNADWTITVKDSNYRWDGKVAERTVNANTVSGYYNNTPLAKWLSGWTTTQPTSSEANSWVNAWNNWTMDIETILTKIGNTKEALPLKNEVIKAIDAQGGVAWRKENDPMVTKVDDLINKLDTASKSNYLNTIAGTVQTSLTNFITGGKSDLLADLKTVIEGGTLQSLIDAKAQGATFGALSNEELKMLQATSSAIAANAIRDPDTKEIIGFRMSEPKLKAELENMKNLFIEKKNRMTGAWIKQEQIPATTTWAVNTAQENDPFGIR